jgi:hypothetical protein
MKGFIKRNEDKWVIVTKNCTELILDPENIYEYTEGQIVDFYEVTKEDLTFAKVIRNFENFTRDEVEKIILTVKDLYSYENNRPEESDKELITWFNRAYPKLNNK